MRRPSPSEPRGAERDRRPTPTPPPWRLSRVSGSRPAGRGNPNTGELVTARSRTVDPLNVSVTADRIDRRAVGPYQLTDDERNALRAKLAD